MISGIDNGMNSLAGIDPAQILQMLQMAKVDPFSRPMPGSPLLGNGNFPTQQPTPPMPPQLPMADAVRTMMANFPQAGQLMPQKPGMNTISTDFTNTQPGLPNLPDSFLGFGYGQFAPKLNQGNPLKQQLIKHLGSMFGQQNSSLSNPIMGGNNLGGM